MKFDCNRNSYKNNEVLHTISNGDTVIYQNRGIRIEFNEKRRVLSTSVLNGGIREDLEGVFNYNCLGEQYTCTLTEDTYEKELAYNATQIGLKGKKVTGLSTAAWIEFVSIKEKEHGDLKVTAIVTGGIDKNAVRVGDPASYYEKNGEFHMIDQKEPLPGTINIILHINKNLEPGVLTRALVTCSEAKVVAIQELMIGSLYSDGLATGSGTDGTILISDMNSNEILTDAGEHSKLGELIGVAVKDAVKEALYLQTGAAGPRQHRVLERGRRYGITLGSLWEYYVKHEKEYETICNKKYQSLCEFEERFLYYETNSSAVVWMSLYLHLLDQYQWGMLKWGEVKRETSQITKAILRIEDEKIMEWLFQTEEEAEIVPSLIERAKRSIISVL